MKLFISYSRDDRAWVYELWRALRDRGHHDAWIDQRIVPATDWWESILENIENCETFVYVMTPKCVESIYCGAELSYALSLNKPILPLMLKACDVPTELKRRRIQYFQVTEKESLGDVLFTCSQGLGEIRVKLLKGEYKEPAVRPGRPEEPTAAKKPEQVLEVFMLAEEAAGQNNLSLAEKLFEQVKEADADGYGLAAAERLGEIRYERGRNADYVNIVQMVNNPSMAKGARALWRVYVGKYGREYDPNNVAGMIDDAPIKTPPTETPAQTAYVPPPAPAPVVRSKPRSVDLMPSPFAWIDIPAGRVTLVTEKGWEANYIPEGQSKTFDVAAFAIGKYPITNGQYAKFVEGGGYRERRWWTEAGWEAREAEKWTEPRYWQDAKWNGGEQPVVGVSWYESVAFCQWVSEMSGETIMLASEQQWQRAAQGDKGLTYPWGNEWDGERCNNSVGKDWQKNKTSQVRQYEGKGNSPFGVVDMAGNVWEWCVTGYGDGSRLINSNTETRVLRGGSWFNTNPGNFRAALRDDFPPDSRYDNIGFRCVRS